MYYFKDILLISSSTAYLTIYIGRLVCKIIELLKNSALKATDSLINYLKHTSLRPSSSVYIPANYTLSYFMTEK
ncbi:hypothetical protein bcgnr5387_66140 [Bacillus luti]